jgi:hypothetical protein
MIPRPKVPEREIDFKHDGAIDAMWKLGLDTFEIASKLFIPEYQVTARLHQIRDARITQ